MTDYDVLPDVDLTLRWSGQSGPWEDFVGLDDVPGTGRGVEDE